MLFARRCGNWVNFFMKKLKKIPKFKNEAEEFEFWAKEDSAGYVDWSKAVSAKFPDLKRSTKTISLRLPVSLLDGLKIMAISVMCLINH